MKPVSDKGIASRSAFTFIFALLVFAFWAFLFPYHLRYHEEVQYFPYLFSHFVSYLKFPGGIVSYISEFLVQFFYVSWLGAVIMALLMSLVQMQAWRLFRYFRKDADMAYYPLSFVPAVCLWAFLAGSGSMISVVTAVLVSVGVWLAVSGSSMCGKAKTALLVLLIPVLYYICGPVAVIFAVLAIIDAFRGVYPFKWWIVVPCVLVVSAVTLLVSIAVCDNYPVKWLCLGVDYCHKPGEYPVTFFVSLASEPLLALVALLVPDRHFSERSGAWIMSLLTAAIAVFSFVFVKKNISFPFERILAYDCAALDCDWDKIIGMADAVTPMTPSEVTCLNLALVMKGESGDRMFNYFQSGPEGLCPNYETGYLMMLPGSEAMYHAGLLNMALHYSFEAYQSFPNARQSSRQLKRMAEINMINGEQAVADKYLTALSKTLFYGKWARRWLSHPDLSEEPEYARLKEFRDTSKGIYNDKFEAPKAEALRNLVSSRRVNDQSYHYLLAYDLLSKDLESFNKDFLLAEYDGPVPVLYQEAIMMGWLRGNDEHVFSSPYVSEEVKAYAREFRESLLAGKSSSYLKARYGKTYWYYFAAPGAEVRHTNVNNKK